VAVRAGAGVYHQFPALAQAFGAHAGHDLRSEQARQYDLSIEHKITPSTRWQATLYRRDDKWGLRLADNEFRIVNGRIVFPSGDGPWENTLNGRATGVDLLVQRSSPRGLSGWASYSFGHARQHDELTGEQFDADFDQRHTVNVWGQYAVSSRTSMSSKLRIGSNYPLHGYWEQRASRLIFIGERLNEVRLPVYARLDVRANRVFNYEKRRLTLFVEVMNVLNRDNVRAVSPSINGRTRLATGYLQSLFPLMPSAVLFDSIEREGSRARQARRLSVRTLARVQCWASFRCQHLTAHALIRKAHHRVVRERVGLLYRHGLQLLPVESENGQKLADARLRIVARIDQLSLKKLAMGGERLAPLRLRLLLCLWSASRTGGAGGRPAGHTVKTAVPRRHARTMGERFIIFIGYGGNSTPTWRRPDGRSISPTSRNRQESGRPALPTHSPVSWQQRKMTIQ
jgi:hypothetical protein